MGNLYYIRSSVLSINATTWITMIGTEPGSLAIYIYSRAATRPAARRTPLTCWAEAAPVNLAGLLVPVAGTTVVLAGAGVLLAGAGVLEMGTVVMMVVGLQAPLTQAEVVRVTVEQGTVTTVWTVVAVLFLKVGLSVAEREA